MKKLDQTELISYLTEVVNATKSLQELVGRRNKTTRIKAISSMLTMVHARADSTLKYVKAGGYSEFPLAFQQGLYNPVIEWLAGEVAV